MPNWCNNTLNVSGDEKSIAAFLSAARGRHAGYKDVFYDIDTDAWPAHDDVRVKALTKDPAPLSDEEYDFCMNALYPVPLDFRRFPFDDNSAYKLGMIVGENRDFGGYRWQSTNWGCKWDVDGELVESHDTFLQYMFDSPWSPPIAFFENIAKDFPTLTFELEYYEPGMGYAGRATFENEDWSEVELPIEHFVDDWDEE